MKKTISIFFAIIITLFLQGETSFAQQSQKSKYTPQQYIDNVISKNPEFKNAVFAIRAIDGKGKVIACKNPNFPLLTASNMKTISTGIGLLCLGENFRFKTQIAYSGSIKAGVLHGNLHIIGGGDPTLGSADSVAFKTDSIFGIWADALKILSINKIEGNIVVDDSYFEREDVPSSWSWGNLGYDYGSAANGLTFNENVINVKAIPAKKVGGKAKIIIDYPTIPNFKYINDLTTGEAKSGDKSSFFVSDLSKVGKFTGTIPIDRDTVKLLISNKFPYLSCGAAFKDFLLLQGIKVGGEIIPIEKLRGKAPKLTPLTESYSPELWKIVEVCNHISNNLYAETIFKSVAKEMTGTGSREAATEYFLKKMKEMGVDTTGYTQDDGSGLSRENYVSPEFFCNFFSMMAEQPVFEKYFQSMPYPGVGTFKNVLKDKPAKYASRVHAKSGSLNCVKTYSGYVLGGKKTGLIKFSILVNNYSCPTSKIQKHLEEFMYAMACTD